MTGLFHKSIEQKEIIKRKKELKTLVKDKQYDKVLQIGSELLEKRPDDLDVLFIVGSIYYMRGKHKTSISYFDKILDISSYDPETLLLKANALFELGQYNEAIKCCNKIQEIDPKNKAVLELLSKINTKQR
ncbi:MAG: tetratricopeptide repeat protein [Nitrosopumilaceae archaeon]|nr:tetratricopeptide repeat protein [Nitrosopumilaceae archaeon]